MSIFEYFLQVNIYLLLFYAFYHMLLRQETFFSLNRIYLLSTALVSFIIPFVHADWINDLFASPELIWGKTAVHNFVLAPITIVATEQVNQFSVTRLIISIYGSITAILLIKLLWELYAVTKIKSASEELAYSFFGKIVVPETQQKFKTIYRHEMVHSKQFHSVDVILFELLSAIIWFNPVVYFYKNSIKQIHEFIADEVVCEEENKADYAILLLSNTFRVQANPLVNNFYNQSLLKKRIMMLQKTKSRKRMLMKYGFIAPLLILMLIFSCTKSEKMDTAVEVTLSPPPPPMAPVSANDTETPINFASVEILPKFPDGGDAGFGKFLGKGIQYPAEAKKNNITGKVIVSFIVEKDGSLSDFKVLRDIGGGCGEEAVRVLKLSPKWIPGYEQGKPVRVAYTCPISFSLASN